MHAGYRLIMGNRKRAFSVNDVDGVGVNVGMTDEPGVAVAGAVGSTVGSPVGVWAGVGVVVAVVAGPGVDVGLGVGVGTGVVLPSHFVLSSVRI